MLADPEDLFNAVWPVTALGHFGRADIVEDEKQYVVELDLPGLEKDDIVVEATDGGSLVVRVDRKAEQEEKKGNYIRRERRASRFYRAFDFDSDADLSSVEATYRNGVLRIEIPKRQPPEGRNRRIEIA